MPQSVGSDVDFTVYGGADAAQHPSGRVGDPMDIANAVMYLSSDAAGFITVKNNNETKTLANECDLVQVNLEMLSSKSYANINFRYKGITPKSTKEEIIEKLG